MRRVFRSELSAASEPTRRHGIARKAGVGVVIVAVTLVALCGVAFANAANPLNDSHGKATSISGTVTHNSDGTYTVDSGTVAVSVGGTWDWGTLSASSTQSTCGSRYGVGWAVDWAGLSTSPTAPGSTGSWQIKGSGKYFHVFDTDMTAQPPAPNGDTYPFQDPCKQVDAQGFPEGPWAAQHTYTAGQTIPAQLCVNVYDLHGTPGKISKTSDFDPAVNGDNSVKTNDFDPAVGAGYCFTPQILNAPTITTSATPTAGPGSPISDTATLAGASPGAGGTITFTAYSDAACKTNVFTSSAVPVSGNGTYGPVSFTPSGPGTYKWIASYSGDSSNAAAAGGCGDAGETSTVAPGTNPSQTLAAHIYDCTNGATTTEVNGGTVAAAGPTTVAGQANPLSTSVGAGQYSVNAGAPAGHHFVVCGSSATITNPTHATEGVNVPPGGTGTAVFYVIADTPTTPALTLAVDKTNDADGNGTFGDDESGTTGASVPFQAKITNTSSVAVVIDSISDVWPGSSAIAPTCAAQVVGVTLAPGASVTCDFTVAGYVPSPTAGDRVDTVTVNAHQQDNPNNSTSAMDTSTVRGVAVLGESVERAPNAPAPGSLARTGPARAVGFVLAALCLLALGSVLVLSGSQMHGDLLAFPAPSVIALLVYLRDLPIIDRRLGRSAASRVSRHR